MNLIGLGFRKRFFILSLYIIIVLPWLIYGAVKILQSSSSSPLDWVDSEYEPRTNYDHFRSLFGDGDILVATWDGCRRDDLRLDKLRDLLQTSPLFRDADNQSYFHFVQTGRDPLQQLIEPPFSLDPNEAASLLTGTFLGPDRLTTIVSVQFNLRGLQKRDRLVPLIRDAITETCNVTEKQIYFSGPIMDGYAVDAASANTMQRTAPMSAVVVLCLCILCVESPVGGILLFLVSLLAQIVSLALVNYSGVKMTALLIVLPPLMQVLSVAGGLHLVHYYFASLKLSPGDHFTAAAHTIRENWLPFSLSAVTTAIGMFSLALSQISAVRDFGILSGTSVLANWCLICFLLPGSLAFFRIESKKKGETADTLIPRRFQYLFRFVTSQSSAITATAMLTMILLSIGLPSLNASVRIETLFAPESRLVQSYKWTEARVGPMVPIELTITFPKETAWNYERKLELLTLTLERLKTHERIRNVFSSTNVLVPVIDRFMIIKAVPNVPEIRSEAVESLVANAIPSLIDMRYLARDTLGQEVWRITAFTSALGSTNYNELLQDLEKDVGGLITNYP